MSDGGSPLTTQSENSTSSNTFSWKRFVVIALIGIIPIAIFLQLPMGTWDQFDELPIHPLVVHFTVVAMPVAAIWLIIAAIKPKVAQKSLLYLWALVVFITLSLVVAKSSGDSLSAAVGYPQEHADAGNLLLTLSYVLAVLVLGLVFLTFVWRQNKIENVLRVVCGVFALALIPMTYIAGHSGAEAVWKEPLAEAEKPISDGVAVITFAEVQRHNSVNDCWTVVDQNVYDVTTFVQRHPAGPGDIIGMCGTNASDDFLGQHKGQAEPEKWLETLKVGKLQG